MAAEAAWALQAGVYALLAGDSTLAALAPGGVHDHAADGVAFPYVQIGPATSRDWSGKTFVGAEHVLAIHVWSRARGRREAKQIADRVHALLHEASPSVAGQTVVSLRFVAADYAVERDGLTTLGALRFRALTQPTS